MVKKNTDSDETRQKETKKSNDPEYQGLEDTYGNSPTKNRNKKQTKKRKRRQLKPEKLLEKRESKKIP